MRSITVAALALLFLLAPLDRAVAQTGHDLLQQALVRERANGDLRGAIAIYERIVRDFRADRPLVANALVQLGSCYERLGSTEAERAYQRVVREFADQAEFVAQARARLAGLRTAAAPGRGPTARLLLSRADIGPDAFHHVEPSPDGRRVVYIDMSDGGVYARDLGSGETQLVAPGRPAVWNYFPIWSPDGGRVAFAEDNLQTSAMVVKIYDLSSRRTTVVPGTQVQGWIDVEDWSRDGRYLLCNPAHNRLGLIPADGGTMTVLTDSAYMGNGALSPDGRFVAYAVGGEENANVFVQLVAGGARRQITRAPGGNYRPHWAPDGRSIAYQRSSGIWVVPMTGGAPSGDARLAMSAANFRLSRWNEAGLFYTQFNERRRHPPYQVPMDPATGRPGPGGIQSVPGDHPDSSSGFAWSPDMARIVFGHQLSPEVTIYSADPRTVVTYNLGWQGHALTPWWSRDGHEVLYAPYDWRNDSSTVVALDVATGRVRELFPRIPNAHKITLSRDGRLMAYFRYPGRTGTDALSGVGTPVSRLTSAGSRIRAVVVAGTGQSDGREVATAGAPGETPFNTFAGPQLSPQGDQVLFIRQTAVDQARQPAPQAASLWVVGSDGRGTRRLGTAALIESAVWDPTGRFIAYSGKPDMADGTTAMIRVVEVTTGVETEIPLPGDLGRNLGLYEWLRVTDWSSDGSLLGILANRDREAPWEYWLVRGLLEGGR